MNASQGITIRIQHDGLCPTIAEICKPGKVEGM